MYHVPAYVKLFPYNFALGINEQVISRSKLEINESSRVGIRCGIQITGSGLWKKLHRSEKVDFFEYLSFQSNLSVRMKTLCVNDFYSAIIFFVKLMIFQIIFIIASATVSFFYYLYFIYSLITRTSINE